MSNRDDGEIQTKPAENTQTSGQKRDFILYNNSLNEKPKSFSTDEVKEPETKITKSEVGSVGPSESAKRKRMERFSTGEVEEPETKADGKIRVDLK